MFLIELTYKKDLTQVDRFLQEQVAYLDQKYAEGVLIFSGRKNPRSGGVILTNVESRDQAEALIAQDPFHREQIADYRLLEFTPTKFDKRFECFIK